MIDLEKALERINNDLGSPHLNSKDVDDPTNPYESIIQKVAQYIETLIPHKIQKLSQILYRVDISEAKTQAAFDLGKTHLAARKLAELIVERSLQKLKTQQEYKKSQDFE